MKTEHQEIIHKHIQKRNFQEIYAFALSQLILSNEKEQEEAQESIKVFEEKYGMQYPQFCDEFDSITQFSMFEKEDDSLDWQVEIERYEAAILDNKELEKLLSEDEHLH